MWKGLAALQLLGRTEPRHARAASDDHGFKGGEANPFPFAIGHQMSPRDCNDDFMNGNKIDIEGVNRQHLQQQQSVPASSSGRCLPDVSDSWRDLESRSSSILTH